MQDHPKGGEDDPAFVTDDVEDDRLQVANSSRIGTPRGDISAQGLGAARALEERFSLTPSPAF